MKRNNRRQGFALIELMIVVVIIGVLAAIALPAYQRYVARAQVTEAMILFGGARSAVNDMLGQTGEFPAAGEASLNELGIRTRGRYVEKIESDGSSVLEATFKLTEVSTAIAGKTLVYTLDLADKQWTCGQGGADPLADPLLTAACKN